MTEVDLPGMTGAELQTTREYLGLTTAWMAEKFQVNERRLQRMEADQDRIPDFLVKFLDETVTQTDQLVTDLASTYRRKTKASEEPVFFKTFRKESQYDDANETLPGVNHNYPAKWHRMVAARVANAVPGLIVSYWDKDEQPIFEDLRAKFAQQID